MSNEYKTIKIPADVHAEIVFIQNALIKAGYNNWPISIQNIIRNRIGLGKIRIEDIIDLGCKHIIEEMKDNYIIR